MIITPSLFAAFLRCPTKCWLRFINESPSGNAYAEWVQTESESYRAAATKRLMASVPDECAPSFGSSRREEAHYSADNLKTAKWKFAVDIPARTSFGSSRGHEAQTPSPQPSTLNAQPTDQSLLPPSQNFGATSTSAAAIETCLHAVKRIPSVGRGQPAQLVPIRFIHRNKLTKDDKLLLAFDALVLSEMLGRAVSLGKIIHGDDHVTLKVKTQALAGEVRKRLGKITALLASLAPPDLVLNRHCAECEFQARCRKLAVEKDDLSLLAGMSAKERQKLRSKGIFTLNQLSFTFRPRKAPKRAKNPSNPRHYALQAQAIREKMVYIHGKPQLPTSEQCLYFDVEGVPWRESYYLIGVLVVEADSTRYHSFWAKDDDQTAMIAECRPRRSKRSGARSPRECRTQRMPAEGWRRQSASVQESRVCIAGV